MIYEEHTIAAVQQRMTTFRADPNSSCIAVAAVLHLRTPTCMILPVRAVYTGVAVSCW